MYCPNCQKNVLTKREDFSFLLAFILAFTGIGLVIYILYYIDKKPNRCVHCEALCELKLAHHQQETPQKRLEDNSNAQLEYNPLENKIQKTRFCHNCGTEIADREGIKYCALCGSTIE